MGADNTFGENNFNPEKMKNTTIDSKDFESIDKDLLYLRLEKTECLINKSNKMTDDTISAILNHCKTNMRIHRDKWLDKELPELERGKSLGKCFAYKDIADGIRNGYFEPKIDE